MISRLQQRLLDMLWDPVWLRTTPTRLLVIALRYLHALGREIASGELTLRAMSLVYTTLMSLVPLLAFSFSLLKGVGVHRQLEPLMQNFLMPLGDEKAVELTEQVVGFVDNLQGTLLGGVGLVFLIFIVISMVQKVEASVNWIWRVSASRSLARKFSEYLSVMLLGPLMMAVALGLTATLSNIRLVQWLETVEPFGTGLVLLGQAMPYAILIFAFTFLYYFIPNTRVKVRAAMVGGAFGGVLWALASGLFAQIVGVSTRVSAIYSSFAIVILALVWLYLSWLILLLGAQLAYYVQHPEHLRCGRRSPELSSLAREHSGLAVMLLLAHEFLQPARRQWCIDTLAVRFQVPPDTLEPVIEALRAAGLVAETRDGHLMPGRSLNTISVNDVLRAVRGVDDIVPRIGDSWSRRAIELRTHAESAAFDSLSEITLQDVAQEAAPAPGSA